MMSANLFVCRVCYTLFTWCLCGFEAGHGCIRTLVVSRCVIERIANDSVWVLKLLICLRWWRCLLLCQRFGNELEIQVVLRCLVMNNMSHVEAEANPFCHFSHRSGQEHPFAVIMDTTGKVNSSQDAFPGTGMFRIHAVWQYQKFPDTWQNCLAEAPNISYAWIYEREDIWSMAKAWLNHSYHMANAQLAWD